MGKNLTLRLALISDIPEIMEASKEFFNENFFTDMDIFPEVDNDSVALIIKKLIELEDAVFIVASLNRVLVGGVAFVLSPKWYNKNYIEAFQILFFVKESHRKNGAGIAYKMLQIAEKEAQTHGAKHYRVSSLARRDYEKLNNFYKKCGFKLIEFYFNKFL